MSTGNFTGELPLIGVKYFQTKNRRSDHLPAEAIRSTAEENSSKYKTLLLLKPQ